MGPSWPYASYDLEDAVRTPMDDGDVEEGAAVEAWYAYRDAVVAGIDAMYPGPCGHLNEIGPAGG